MNAYFIFSDASYDPKSHKGVGAFLITEAKYCNSRADWPAFIIHTHLTKDESIARLEFITAIRSLREWKILFQNKFPNAKISLIIDCKAISNLLLRRKRLENCGFISKSKGQVLTNADLYVEFLSLYDELLPEIVWVKGHSQKSDQSLLQEIFSLVDKTARKTLRKI